MKKIRIWALFAACFSNLIAAGAPVDFTVQVNGPDGPLGNFPLAVFQKGQPQQLRAETNQEGNAHFSLDSTMATEIRVSAKLLPGPSGESVSNRSARIEQFRSRCQSLALPDYWEFVIPLNQGPVSKSISIARGVKLTVQPVGLPQNIYPRQTLLVPGVRTETSKVDIATGTVPRFGVPLNTASVGFLQFSETEKPSRAVAFSIPAATTDINIGVLTIPPLTMNATVNIRQLWTKATDPRPVVYRGVGARLGGVTLVSTDGLTILSDALNPENPMNIEGIEHVKASVSAGTFYVLPGVFAANPEQMVVISRLRAGQDLSNRGLPMFTIAVGEEKSIDINNVDMLNAIHAIEDGN